MPDEAPSSLISPALVHAGPTDASLDGVDLRGIGRAGEGLLDRVYVAVRAADWSTVPGEVSDILIRAEGGAFRVTFRSRHRAGALDFEWRGSLVGTTDGRIICEMSGEALTDFDYCRIGFCVLHPGSLAGAAYLATTAEGDVRGRLPRLIAPQLMADGAVVPPIPPFGAMSVTSAHGEVVHIRSAGEPFELEDQRNWTDASFKSYIPPIRPGYPYAARTGQRFWQRIEIRIDSGPLERRRSSTHGPVQVQVLSTDGRTLPPIGFGLPDPASYLELAARDAIADLRPDHLRLELWPGRSGEAGRVDDGIRWTRDIGGALEVALFIDDARSDSVERVISRLAGERVARWMVFDADLAGSASTSAATVRSVRQSLDALIPGASLVAGTASDFVHLNRGRTLFHGVDALTWAIAPTVHATDDRSVMENAFAQGATVETARSFADGRRLCIGPIELTRRGEPPDPRQTAQFAAAWTVASLADLCAVSPDSVTYFTLIGPRGILASAGEPFPVYDVFRQLSRMRDRPLCPMHVAVHRVVAGVAVDGADGPIGMLANLTADRLSMTAEQLGTRGLGPYETLFFG